MSHAPLAGVPQTALSWHRLTFAEGGCALPSLNGVKAFEAAAPAAVAGAAEELNVTPAAISRLVRLLEARLAVPLFERRANGLRLTPAGIAIATG